MNDPKTVETVLLMCVKNDHLLLATKKRGLGNGKLNGAGGKIEAGESPEQATVREAAEEFGISVASENLRKVAVCVFLFEEPPLRIRNHVFWADSWEGTPHETDEMGPLEWHASDKLPFERMWDDDRLWIPRVLEGERLSCEFWFASDNQTIAKHHIVALREEDR